jgi:hypothetical protein
MTPERAVAAFDIPDAWIEAKRDEYMHLVVTDTDSKSQFYAVNKARLEIKSKRVAVEKKRKELTSDALAWQRTVNTEAKRLTSLLDHIEEYLITQCKLVEDAEVEKARLEALRIETERKAAEEVERERIRLAQEAENSRLAAERERLAEERRLLQEARDRERIALESQRQELAAAQAALESQRKALVAAVNPQSETVEQAVVSDRVGEYVPPPPDAEEVAQEIRDNQTGAAPPIGGECDPAVVVARDKAYLSAVLVAVRAIQVPAVSDLAVSEAAVRTIVGVLKWAGNKIEDAIRGM